jgi:predicted SprT family Zn-dependent metalloprotease
MKHRNTGPRISFRERVYRFMYGRNGTDALCKALFVVYLILIIVNLFVKQPYATIMSALELALGAYIIFRIMSRNIYQRQRENQWYLRQVGRVKGFFALQKNKRRDRKTHVYRKCKHCKNVLRLPRSKGKHTVKCPCCQKRFDIKI